MQKVKDSITKAEKVQVKTEKTEKKPEVKTEKKREVNAKATTKNGTPSVLETKPLAKDSTMKPSTTTAASSSKGPDTKPKPKARVKKVFEKAGQKFDEPDEV